MNEEARSRPELEIVEKILADADAEVQRIVQNAHNVAEAEREKARKEAQEIQAQILDQAEESARKLRSREASTAQIEAKRLLLTAREEAVSKIVTQIEERLRRIREDPNLYRQSLRNLAAEAILAVRQPAAVLKVSRIDGSIADERFLDGVRTRVSVSSGSEVRIDLELDDADMGGGCIATSAEGRIVLDNTFRRRLERMKPQLRSLIAKELRKGNE
jgi:vacuolar-type H+-ATPase subunit E/Vma4